MGSSMERQHRRTTQLPACSIQTIDLSGKWTVTPVVNRRPLRTETTGIAPEQMRSSQQSRRYTLTRSSIQFIPTAHVLHGPERWSVKTVRATATHTLTHEILLRR